MKKNRRVAQAKIRTKFGSFRGTRRAELAQIVTALAEMPIRRSFFWFSRNREKAKKYSSSLVFPANERAERIVPTTYLPTSMPLASKKYFPCSLRKGSGHSAAGNPDEPQESHTMFGSDDDDDVGAL